MLHLTLGFWFVYIAGQALHILKRAHLGAGGIRGFFQRNWIALLVRLFLATALLMWWAQSPGFLNTLLGRFGVTVGFELPLTWPTAAIYGFFSDSILDWVISKVPFLQSEVPAINGAAAAAAASAGSQPKDR